MTFGFKSEQFYPFHFRNASERSWHLFTLTDIKWSKIQPIGKGLSHGKCGLSVFVHSVLSLILILILLCGDVEVNPGPTGIQTDGAQSGIMAEKPTLGNQADGAQGRIMAEKRTLDSKPTISQLNLMDIGGKAIRIMQNICGKWMIIGYLLNFDDMGNKVSTIKKDTSGQENCLNEVLRMWMNGESRAYQPATWRQFIRLLNDSEFGALAKSLEDCLGSM